MATITQLSSGRFRVQIRRKAIGKVEEYFDTREEASAWAIKTESELLARHHVAVPGIKAGTKSFAEVVEAYFRSPRYRDKASSTQDRERDASKRVLEYFGNYAIAVIDTSMVQEYFDVRGNEKKRLKGGKQTNERISGNTLRLEKAFLTAVFRFARVRKYVPSNIMYDDYEMLTCQRKEETISLDQQVTIFGRAKDAMSNPRSNQCFLPWLYFVFETGCRPGEAAKIELEWLDLEAGRAYIPRRGQKKRNPRVVLLREELVEVLREQRAKAVEAGSKFLFWSRRNEPRSKSGNGKPLRRRRTKAETDSREMVPYAYYHPWRRICAKAGVSPKINPHLVRHTFITRLFEHTDFSDSQIAALVGDVNVLSLAPYKHIRVMHLQDKSDAHLKELDRTLDEIRETRWDQFREHLRSTREKACNEREAQGDYSTPIQRLHARLMAAKQSAEQVEEGT